jgi:general stress protein 26
MSHETDTHVAAEAMLAGASETIRKTRYCWLLTEAEDGRIRQRPMGRLLHEAREDAWTIRFVTDGRSRKVADLRRQPRVTLIFQRAPDDAFITMTGNASLCESPAEVAGRWVAAYDAYFPTAEDRANGMFVEVDVERIELWIRGVTPEPFGLRPTILERDARRAWRVVSADNGS